MTSANVVVLCIYCALYFVIMLRIRPDLDVNAIKWRFHASLHSIIISTQWDMPTHQCAQFKWAKAIKARRQVKSAIRGQLTKVMSKHPRTAKQIVKIFKG